MAMAATYIKRLLNLEHLPHLTEPVSAQRLRPALKTVHLTGGSVQVALLQERLRASKNALDVVAVGQTLLLEHDLAEEVARRVAGDARLLGQEGRLAHLVGHYSEPVNELRRVGEAALVGGRVDGRDGSVDDGVLGRDLLEGHELAGKGPGVRGVLEAGADGIDGHVELLRAQVGVHHLVPARCELLELRHGRRQLVQLAEPALALRLDVVLHLRDKLLLQGERLLQKLVVKTLLVKLLLALQHELDALVVARLDLLHLVLKLLPPLRLLHDHGRLDARDEVVGGLVKVGYLGLHLGSRLLLDRRLDGLDLAAHLAQLALGLGDGRRIAAVGLVGVNDGDDVVEHADKVLNHRLGRVLDLQGVDRRDGGEPRRLVDLGRLEPGRVLLLGRGGRLSLLDGLGRGCGCGLGSLRGRLGLLDRVVMLLLDSDDLGSGLFVDGARLAAGGLAVVGHPPGRAALGGDIDLAARVSSLELVRDVGESLAEVGLLKVEDGLLAKGNKLGEEVVEVVIDARVPHAAAEADSSEDGESQDEVPQSAEEALLLRGSVCGRQRRRCGSLRLGDNGVRSRGREGDVFLRDRRLDEPDLGDFALLGRDGLRGRQGGWSGRVSRLLVVGKVSPAGGGSDLPLAANDGRRRPVAEHPHGSNRCSQHEGMRWAYKA
ncbi:hypothetical protein CTA1_5890 [Colletotrichum tanaceti]|uniref:Uncharacterized protein n=1 Tax=Colletotrichum tanaceti TaxID=1306861 RepID=A0A4U6XKB6_9PEZI|nr:hypothetical protein CTA1_5890 [Colletotrichum tanaceti]